MNPEVVRYIQENRGTYTREAITRSLLDAGHDPAEIERAWSAAETPNLSQAPSPLPPSAYGTSGDVVVEDSRPEPPTVGRVLRTPRFWAAFLGYTLLSVVLTVGLTFLGTLGAGLPVFLLTVLAGIVASLFLFRRDRPVAVGLASAALIVFILPWVALTIWAGLCIVTGSPIGG